MAVAARAGRGTGPAEIAESQHRISTLQSGVRVVTERMPAVRSVAIGCLVGTGSALEPARQSGISHLLEHMLFRGTARHRSEEIDQIFDAMGSELDAQTDREVTSLSTRVLDRHLGRAFDVMGEMLWQPKLEQLSAEREVVLEEIAMYEDDPQERIFDILGEAIFGEHPLGRPVIGSAATVASITQDDLAAYHAERYLPGNVVIAAAGSVDHDELVEMAGALAPEGAPAARTASEDGVSGMSGAARTGPDGAVSEVSGAARPVRDGAMNGVSGASDAPPRQVRFFAKETEQYHLCIGGRGLARSDERRWALRVLEGVLGGGASSRLFQEVRERRGLAYSVFCFSGLYAHTGEIGIYVGTRPENLSETVSVIAAELERALEDPATRDELERSKDNVKGRMVLALESTGARMARLGGSILHDLPLLTIDEAIERIDAVSVADLRELAHELLRPDALSVAAIGPEEARFAEAVQPLQAVVAR